MPTNHHSHEHDHHHEHEGQPVNRRPLLFATVGSATVAMAEIFFGSSTFSSSALLADAAHNLGDSSSYGINLVSSAEHRSAKTSRRLRRAAASIICLGASFVGVRAGLEVANGNFDRPADQSAWIAGGALAVNTVIHRRLVPHKHTSGSHADSARHALTDVLCSVSTFGAVLMARHGLEMADPISGIITSSLTIAMNVPTTSRLNNGPES